MATSFEVTTIPITHLKRGRKADAGKLLRETADPIERTYFAPDNSRIGCDSRAVSSNPSDVVAIMRRSEVMMAMFPDAIDRVWLRAAKGYATQSIRVTVV
jgi:hypothetical protein